MYYPAVAHNCHSKTKSHGTTNFTHGKQQNIINLRQNKINSRQNKENELVSGWSAVVICI